MSQTRNCGLAVAIIAVLASGCGSDRGPASQEPVDREAVVAAFVRAGEPLAIRLDLAAADPDSVVDVIFVPEAQDVPEPPFQLAVFEEIDAAEEHAQILESVGPSGTEVIHWKNVILTSSTSLGEDRRTRIVEALRSL